MKILRLTILALLLSVNLLFAQEELQKVKINLFEGGQNSADLSDIISANQGVLMQNVVLNKKGQLFKRKGQSVFPHWSEDLSNTAFNGAGIFYPDANTKYFLAASGVSVIRSDSSNASWVIVNSEDSLTIGKTTEFLQANDLVFIINGYDNTAAYNGTTWDPGSSSTASPPVATTIAWLRNYLFCAGKPSTPDWVFFSNNLAPRTFTVTDVFKVNTGDGQIITKLESFKLNELIIYKERSIYDLDITGSTPLTDWTLQPISRVVGCPAPRSVVNIGNDHWFLSSEPFAIRSLVRTSFDKLFIDMVSTPIQDILDGTGSRTLNKTQVSRACAILFDNKYFLAIPTGTSTVNDYVLAYDFIMKSWYVIDGWYPKEWVVFNNELYYIDETDGRILKCFQSTYSDMASGPIVTTASQPTIPIEFDYISKNIDFDNPENYKQLDALELEVEAVGNYTADVYIDIDNAGWRNIGTITMTSTAPTLPADLPIVLSSDNISRKMFQLQQYGEFRKIKLRVIQNGVNEQFNLHSFTFFAYPKQWRREG